MAYRWKVALVYLLGFALDLLNMFVASIAYPDIAQQLHASVTELAWISNAYMLGLTLIIPLSVWLAARVGERRLILGSLLLFGLASIWVAGAGSIESLIGWRLVQGLSGGLLIPIGQSLAFRQFPAEQRSSLTTWVMSVALLVPALSPAAGGLIVQALSWRWVFYLNVPFTLLALLLGALWLKVDEPPKIRPPLILRNLLDLQLLRSPSLRLAMLVYLLIPGVFIGTSLIAVLYLHQRGWGSAQIGALMLPWALGSALAIAMGKRGFNRWGPKPLLLVGALLQSAGIGLLVLIDQPQGWLPIIAYALMGLGGSLCSSCAQTLAFVDVHPERMNHASALWNINRQLSFCLGAAVLSSLLGALGPQSPDAFERCFLVAAVLSLLPILAVLRFDSAGVQALVNPTQEQTS
ncbi:MFS transporter [Pseudomonas sp. N3-W]|uniref:MFS transporter n=1 Tax=Pseudomonas fungipugnans TaxID=3024217 RepID=A0ABT6QSK8_9PSED|nr:MULTISPECIES: MFS transporter [unclassified Pseudomonas]MDI2593875.1 MFS transporter [Pseudomonas sp. 681]UWF50321.1 MFS transporter [Pseudomonas sp. N3-W]